MYGLSLIRHEPAGIAQGPGLHEMRVMVLRIGSVFAFAAHDTCNHLLEIKRIGQAEDEPELILPCVACGFLRRHHIGQRPARTNIFEVRVIGHALAERLPN